ncbi:MAG: hypothetical protein VCC01_10200 [Candidatus Hydrogenedentota bacterium]
MKALLKMSVLALAMVVISGCASNGGGGGASDKDLVDAIIADQIAALKEQDIDRLAAQYSEDFESDQGGDLAGTKEFINSAIEGGLLDGLEIDLSSMETTFPESGKASVGPVDLEASFGTMTLEFDLEKRDGTWLIVYMAQY